MLIHVESWGWLTVDAVEQCLSAITAANQSVILCNLRLILSRSPHHSSTGFFIKGVGTTHRWQGYSFWYSV